MLKSVVKNFCFIFFFLFFYETGTSQKIFFCEKVNADGSPVNKKNEFLIKIGKDNIFLLVEKKDSLKTDSVIYKIFSLDIKNNRKLEFEYKEKVNPEQTWCKRQVLFKKEGLYDIIVYDRRRNILCSDYLKIRRKK
jgi:hypothetical protein